MTAREHLLIGRRVILLWSSGTRSFPGNLGQKSQQNKGEIFLRGLVKKVDQIGVHIIGVQTVKKVDTQSVREFPIDEREKSYYIPWTAIAGVEIIEEGSEDEKIDNIICERDRAPGF
jgi:hypothetical protein